MQLPKHIEICRDMTSFIFVKTKSRSGNFHRCYKIVFWFLFSPFFLQFELSGNQNLGVRLIALLSIILGVRWRAIALARLINSVPAIMTSILFQVRIKNEIQFWQVWLDVCLQIYCITLPHFYTTHLIYCIAKLVIWVAFCNATLGKSKCRNIIFVVWYY